MFDWDGKLGEDEEVDPRDPLAIFESLDRKATHTVLRPVQTEALRALRERHEERDLVLKLSTGAGKTTIALVYLHSMMKSSGQPVAYLCPTKQLVRQVLDEAENLGIPGVEYPANQPHPGVEAISGEALVVCTYDKLFNAMTTFERDDVNLRPHAIVMDDAHAGIQEVRDSFTLSIPASSRYQPAAPKAYAALVRLLEPACKKYLPAAWTFIERGHADSVLEVPFWLWAPLVPEVMSTIAEYADEKPFCFVWPYLANVLRWCRCVVSGTGIEIVPSVLPVDGVSPYYRAEHRLFMSATLSDDSALVRELGCDVAAALNPIVPPSDAGLGERMVLAPTLVDPKLDRAWVMRWCADLARSESVVVLCASEKHAKEWANHGAAVVIRDGVEDAVQKLRNGSVRFVAFAQRYDGIDLPDDACRVLVLDGMPKGSGMLDTLDGNDPDRPGGNVDKWVHRIEQGMGRAVRSHADYATIILAGASVTHFVAQADVRERLGRGTRAQLDLARELMVMVKDAARTSTTEAAVRQMARQCLDRDKGWKRFYDQKVRKASKAIPRTPDLDAIRLAEAEKLAFDEARSNDPHSAAQRMDVAITKHVQGERYKGWYMQKQADYLFDADPSKAMELQKQAYRKNRKLMLPPLGVTVRRPPAERLVQPSIVHAWLSKFVDGNGAVVEFNSLIRPKLSFEATAERFEQGLAELAALVGAEGSRPEREFGRGPDDLWEWSDCDWVIEAKSERQRVLPKSDGEQLLAAMEWHREVAPERKAVPVVASRIVSPEHDAYFPEGTRVLTPEKLAELLGNVERLVAELATDLPLFRNADRVRDALQRHGLASENFLARYTVPLGKHRSR